MVTSFGKLFVKECEVDTFTNESFREWLSAKSRAAAFDPRGGRKLVKQADKAACDINVLMKRWEQHGMPIPAPGRQPMYGDFSDGRTYQECVDRVISMGEDFMKLPAAVRKACDNDAGKFIEMCNDAERVEELKALGLIEERVPGAAERMVRLLEERLPVASPTASEE